MRGALRLLRRLVADLQGGALIVFSVTAPLLAVLACSAIDLAEVGADHAQMQDAADATALAMAKQLGLATAVGMSARATAFADQELGPVATRDGVSVGTAIAADNSSVTVTLSGARQSFFGNLLPPGGWKLNAKATAATLGSLPLCVLSSGAAAGDDVDLGDSSTVSASKCLVQSNQNITVNGSASLTAGLAQASGTATGPITPAPQAGAPTISDPFASLSITPVLFGLCQPLDLLSAIVPVAPGTHCGTITVPAGHTVMLLPGEHYFKGAKLIMQQNSTLTGSNVVLVFDDTSTFSFNDTSTISLSGATYGRFAGFVIATTRNNTGTFAISSTSARQLEGTIYIPSATLSVTGAGNTVNDQAAWTVVIAKALKTSGTTNLVINSNYSSSNVPVPTGVGNSYSTGKVKLTQ